MVQQMRVCWNWQTGTFEGRVLYSVWVQVPLLAPKKLVTTLEIATSFYITYFDLQAYILISLYNLLAKIFSYIYLIVHYIPVFCFQYF